LRYNKTKSFNYESVFATYFFIILVYSLIFVNVWIDDVPASGYNNNLTYNSTTSLLQNNSTFGFSNNIPLEYDPRNGTIIKGTIEFSGEQIPVTYEQINNSYVLEGDIILNERLSGEINRAAVDQFFTSHPWPQGLVPYKIDSSILNQKLILDAINQWESKTPVRFIPINDFDNSNTRDYILFVRSSSGTCASSIGSIGGEQPLYVADDCTTGTLMHEIGHALGLWHEHSRLDRDKYVQIKYEYIDKDKKFNFDQHICSGITLTSGCEGPKKFGPYDYCSIMHYVPIAFSKYPFDKSKMTIVPTQPVSNCEIGQRDFLSEGDINAIRDLYGSDVSSTSSTNVDFPAKETQLDAPPFSFNLSPQNKTIINQSINNQ
jgi:hypothetical protein